MIRKPLVMTRLGPGILYKIKKDNAIVEFEYTYLVEIPLKDLDLTEVDLSNVDVDITEECSENVVIYKKLKNNRVFCYFLPRMAGFFTFLSKNLNTMWAKIKSR